MRTTHWIILVLAVALAYTGYTTFISTKNLTVKTYDINLQAQAPTPVDPGSLTPTNSHNCPSNAPAGCVQFDKATVGTITFKVENGGKKDETCENVPQPQWIITKVELTAAGDPLTGKGNFTSPPQPIPTWLTDAFPTLNAVTGVVYEPSTNAATSWAAVTDWNNNKAEEGVKTLYYKVTASHCDGTDQVMTDPMVRNAGK
jgi:hypothetical protein